MKVIFDEMVELIPDPSLLFDSLGVFLLILSAALAIIGAVERRIAASARVARSAANRDRPPHIEIETPQVKP